MTVLSPELDLLAEAIANRVVERLGVLSAPVGGQRLVDAAKLAEALGVSRRYVYDHREQLGAVALGGGSKPRLRFDLEVARAACACLRGERSQTANPSSGGRSEPPTRRRPARLPNGLPEPGSVLTVRPQGAGR